MIQRVCKKILKYFSAWRKKRVDYLESMVGPPGAWTITQDFQFSFLLKQNLQPHHRLLDIGCGPLRGGLPLIEYLDPGGYTGLDIRPKAIEEANREVRKKKLQSKKPILIVSNSFGQDELGDQQYDFIWIFQVFYHLEDALADFCVGQVARRLAPGGVSFANVNLLTESGLWQEFPYVRKDLPFYEDLARKHNLTLRCLGQLKDFNYPDQLKGKTNHLLEFRRPPSNR